MSYDAFDNNDSLDADFGSAITVYPISVAMWVKNSAAGWNSTGADVAFHFNDEALDTGDNGSSLRLTLTDAAADRVTASQFRDNGLQSEDNYDFTADAYNDKWVVVVGVWRDDADCQVYIENSTNTSGPSTTSIATITEAWRYLRIGGDATSGFSAVTNGKIAEIAVFDKALTTTEIDNLQTAAQTGPAPNTVASADCIAYWSLDSDQSSHADESGNGGPALTETGTVAYAADHPTITSGSGSPWNYYAQQ